MADEIDNVFSIVKLLNNGSANQKILLYTPSTITIQGTQIKYFGLLNTLRLNAYIPSLTQIELPPLDPAASTAEIQQRNLELLNAPHKLLRFYLKKGSEEIEIASMGIYPNKPRFLTDCILYFTELQLYGIQHGVEVYVENVAHPIYGALSGDDWISIQGSIVEKTNIYFDSATLTPVNLIF